MSRFPGVPVRGRVLSRRSAVAAGVLAVIGVLIALQTGGFGPVGTDAGAAHVLRAGAVGRLNAGSPGGLNANKHLAWLSMWSPTRDAGCSGGAQMSAQPMCSSVAQSPDAFTLALGGYQAGG